MHIALPTCLPETAPQAANQPMPTPPPSPSRAPSSLADDSGSDNAEVGGLSEQEMTQIDHATRVSELDAEAAAEA